MSKQEAIKRAIEAAKAGRDFAATNVEGFNVVAYGQWGYVDVLQFPSGHRVAKLTPNPFTGEVKSEEF